MSSWPASSSPTGTPKKLRGAPAAAIADHNALNSAVRTAAPAARRLPQPARNIRQGVVLHCIDQMVTVRPCSIARDPPDASWPASWPAAAPCPGRQDHSQSGGGAALGVSEPRPATAPGRSVLRRTIVGQAAWCRLFELPVRNSMAHNLQRSYRRDAHAWLISYACRWRSARLRPRSGRRSRASACSPGGRGGAKVCRRSRT
jgi:hypothetical protein